MIKTKIADTIGEKYGIENYLIENNFNKDIDLKGNTNYVNYYNFVPPWVLTKILSFGTISRLFGLMKQEEKQKISKNFNLSDKQLKNILGTLTTIRNICAHDDRLFTYKSTFFINKNKIYNQPILINKNIMYSTIFVVIMAMKKLLDEQDYNQFLISIKLELKILEKELSSININDVLSVMGFPKDYKFE